MIPLILGFGSAALFLGLSISVYGIGELVQVGWVSMVFWGLIGTGVAVSAIGRPMPNWVRRLREHSKLSHRRLDSGAPCRV